MTWVALIKALLDWLKALIREDTKASDSDTIPKSMKDRWRDRIEEQENQSKNEQNSDTTD